MSTATLLTAAPQLSRFDAHQWVLRCPSGHDLLINEATAKLVRLLDGAPSLEVGRQRFNTDFAHSLSLGEFQELVQGQLGGYQLLQQDNVATRAAVTGPIRHRIEFLPGRWAGWLAQPLSRLYAPRLFWPMLAGLSIGLLSLYQVQPVLTQLPAAGWGLALFYLSVPVHELGHIAACRRAGVSHGGIGVGIYYFFPLLYADISGIWHASRQQRLIANLGGIFSQLLYAGLLAGVGILLHQGVAVAVAEVVAVSAAWQLNPFLQHDGYWILSDVSNTPNLLGRSQQLRTRLTEPNLLRRLQSRPLTTWLRDPRIWVLAYGLLNSLLLGLLVGYALLNSRRVLPVLPELAHTILSKLHQGNLTLADFPSKALTVLAVYGWLLRMAVGRILRTRRRPPVG